MADEPCAKSIDWLYKWCAGLIPSVYDESLSYYEQIAKVLSVLEEVIKHLGETDANAEELKRLYYSLKEQFDEFVDGGFEEYYEALLRAWIDENAPSIVKDMLLTGVFFGLTSDGYFCAYKPSTWEDVQFDTGAIYGTDEYGRLILRYEVNGQGVINNTGYDASVMSDTIDSRLKAIAGNGLEYDAKEATINVLKADDTTFGGVKLKHDVDNDDTDEWAVTSDGVYSYAPSKDETITQPNSGVFTDILPGVTLSIRDTTRIGGLIAFGVRVQTDANTTVSAATRIARTPAWVGGVSSATSTTGTNTLQLDTVGISCAKSIEPNSDMYFWCICKYKG